MGIDRVEKAPKPNDHTTEYIWSKWVMSVNGRDLWEQFCGSLKERRHLSRGSQGRMQTLIRQIDVGNE